MALPAGSRIDLAVWGMLQEDPTTGNSEGLAALRLPLSGTPASPAADAPARTGWLTRQRLKPVFVAVYSFAAGLAVATLITILTS